MFVFIVTRGNITRLGELGQTFVVRRVIRLLSSVKTGTRRIIHLDELSCVVCRPSRITEDGSSRRIMRLVPVFTPETNSQTNKECLPKFVETVNVFSSIKTAIVNQTLRSRSMYKKSSIAVTICMLLYVA